MSAMPMGAPGWPLLAFCTASMLRARMALARSRRLGIAESPAGAFHGKAGIFAQRAMQGQSQIRPLAQPERFCATDQADVGDLPTPCRWRPLNPAAARPAAGYRADVPTDGRA